MLEWLVTGMVLTMENANDTKESRVGFGDVSPSGLGGQLASGPVADTTGKDMSPSGLGGFRCRCRCRCRGSLNGEEGS